MHYAVLTTYAFLALGTPVTNISIMDNTLELRDYCVTVDFSRLLRGIRMSLYNGKPESQNL